MSAQNPSRRTLVKGAAWSVPVVAISQAAPAMAASPCRIRVTRRCEGGSLVFRYEVFGDLPTGPLTFTLTGTVNTGTNANIALPSNVTREGGTLTLTGAARPGGLLATLTRTSNSGNLTYSIAFTSSGGCSADGAAATGYFIGSACSETPPA